jgi:hypothetical protein
MLANIVIRYVWTPKVTNLYISSRYSMLYYELENEE